jgi:hypothetical protein
VLLGCEIGDEGAISIATQLLQNNQTLTELDVSGMLRLLEITKYAYHRLISREFDWRDGLRSHCSTE